MSKLVIVRHHESEWNKLGLWTGLRDRHLTEYGFKKSEELGDLLTDIHIDCAYCSMQVRSIETLSCILEKKCQFQVPTEHCIALNERDYGDYTGKSKWEMEKEIGEEQWQRIRRDWDCPVPHGETLKMVYERVVPFYKEHIVPKLNQQKTVLIVSHGNALRALMKYIESIDDDQISHLEMLFSTTVIYETDEEGKMVKKEIRKIEGVVHA